MTIKPTKLDADTGIRLFIKQHIATQPNTIGRGPTLKHVRALYYQWCSNGLVVPVRGLRNSLLQNGVLVKRGAGNLYYLYGSQLKTKKGTKK